MRLAFDASCWSNRRGFGRYTRELLRRLVPLAVDKGHRPILVVDRQTSDQVAAAELEGAELRVASTRQQPTRAAAATGSRSPVDLWRMSRALAAGRADVVFFPAVYSFFPVPRGLRSVVTFHDAIAEQMPEMIFPSRRARWFWTVKTRWALASASRVVTVSESARRQVAEVFSLDPESISVSGEGPASELSRPSDPGDVAARYGLEPVPRLLYVGGLSPHKNLDGLLQALVKLKARPWQLLLVGELETEAFHSCYESLVELAQRLGLADRVQFTGFVPHGDLAALYSLADVLVLPSWSEGFGLPAVEAMSFGVPVAASRAGSLPEVVGDAGLFFDPADPAEMAGVLGRLLDDPELRERLGRRGLEQARRHSWEAAARRVLGVLESVAEARR